LRLTPSLSQRYLLNQCPNPSKASNIASWTWPFNTDFNRTALFRSYLTRFYQLLYKRWSAITGKISMAFAESVSVILSNFRRKLIIGASDAYRAAQCILVRKEDLRQVDGGWVARITPDAGTVKSGGYRDVPLHRQIIEEGFVSVLTNAPSGPLFHNSTDHRQHACESL
jgi:integrase